MKLEEQCVSLELAKRLKELNCKQESLFYWVITLTTDYHISFYDSDLPECLKERNDCYSAFTASEIGKLLPSEFPGYTESILACYLYFTGSWNVRYEDDEEKRVIKAFYDDSNEANARAKMLIYLIEIKIMKKELLKMIKNYIYFGKITEQEILKAIEEAKNDKKLDEKYAKII